MISLKDREWKPFILGDIFTITRGNASNIINRATNDGKGVIISAIDNSNGFYSNTTFNNKDKVYRDTLTVNNNGNGVCLAYYHPYKFVSSSDVSILENKTEIKFNKYIFEFFICLIEKQKTKYNYGYKMSNGRMTKQSIMLPVNKNGNPDYEFMETYMRERESNLRKIQVSKIQKHLNDLGDKKSIAPIDSCKWKPFKSKSLFDDKKGNQNNMNSLDEGDFPLISAKNKDNGLKAFVKNNKKSIFEGNTISLNCDGDGGVGYAFYQPKCYMLDSHCRSLKHKTNVSKYSLLFISSVFSKQRQLFSHGRAINDKRYKELTIMLPTKENNEPDYEYMEQYIKNGEIDKYNEYLGFLKL